MRFLRLLLPLLAGYGLAASAPFSVTSPGGPGAFACRQASPPLTFGTPPRGTRGLALIVWDQTPARLLGRWVVYDLAPNVRAVPAKLAPGALGKQGVNEAGQPGYGAPCGARGRHDVYVDLYALDTASLNLPDGAPLQTVHRAIKRHKLREVKLHVVTSVP